MIYYNNEIKNILSQEGYAMTQLIKDLEKMNKRLEKETIGDKLRFLKLKIELRWSFMKMHRESKRCAKIISKLGPIKL